MAGRWKGPKVCNMRQKDGKTGGGRESAMLMLPKRGALHYLFAPLQSIRLG